MRDGKLVREVGIVNKRIQGNDFKDAKPGDVVEACQERTEPYNVIFTTTYRVSKPHPVIHSEVMIGHSSKVLFKQIKASYFRIYNTNEQFGDKGKLIFNNLPPVPKEPFTKPFESEGVWFQICFPIQGASTGNPLADEFGIGVRSYGTADSWDTMPKTILTSVENDVSLGMQVRSAAVKELGKTTGPAQMSDVKRAYELAVGKNLENKTVKTGDFKLFTELLGALGLKPEIIYIRTRDAGPLDTSWPSTYQFNHKFVSVRVGDQLVWLDPSYAGIPFGQLPWWEQNAGIFTPSPSFWATNDAFGLTKVTGACTICPRTSPVLDISASPIEREVRLSKTDKGIHMDITVMIDGQPAIAVRNALLYRKVSGKGSMEELVGNSLPVLVSGKNAPLKWEVDDLENLDKPLLLKATCDIPVSKTEPAQVQANPFKSDFADFENSTRIRDVQFPYLQKETTRVVIDKKSGIAVTVPVAGVNKDVGFAKLEQNVTDSPEELKIETVVTEVQADIPVTKYNDVISLRDAIQKWGEQKLTLNLK
jgi:hypothetical protein